MSHQRKTITTLSINSKLGTWELLINYFKQHYRTERIAAGNLKHPSLPIVTQWVKMAWDSIDPAIIIITKLFKKCSISNHLDGTEDDCGLNSMTNPTLTPTKMATRCMMTHEQQQQMFSEESDDDEFLGFESILLIFCVL